MWISHLVREPYNQPLPCFTAAFFRALAHPVRLSIVELLRDGALSVDDLQERLVIDAASVSQQHAVLRGYNIVESHRIGLAITYTVRDPDLFRLLDIARDIFAHRFAEGHTLCAAGVGCQQDGKNTGVRSRQ